MGISNLLVSRTAYRSEVPEENPPLAVRGRQIGGAADEGRLPLNYAQFAASQQIKTYPVP